MSFDLDLPEKDLASAQFMTTVNRRLIADFLRIAKSKNLTRKQIADALGIDKAGVTRMLRGNANLTTRTIGELCWALGIEPDFHTRDIVIPHNGGAAYVQHQPFTAAPNHLKAIIRKSNGGSESPTVHIFTQDRPAHAPA